MKTKTSKLVCLAIFIVLLVAIFVIASKYLDQVRYIESTFDIKIRDMVEKPEGTVKPGFVFMWSDSMQIKLRIKNENKADFLKEVASAFPMVMDAEDMLTTMLELSSEMNEIFGEYVEEIRASEIEQAYITWASKDGWDRPRFIFVTNQDGEMVAYFMDVN